MIAKIMLVDDEEGVRALVSITLGEDERYRLFQAQNGKEALEVARRERPDLIFLDVRMPDLDGYQVCRALKGDPITAPSKVIMLTALSSEDDRRRGAAAGADDYFTKPFSPTKLLEKVEEVLSAAGGPTASW